MADGDKREVAVAHGTAPRPSSSAPSPSAEEPRSHLGLIGMVGALLIPLVCCGGPILLGAVGATGAGAFLAGSFKDWLIAGILAAVALVALATWLFERRHRQAASCNLSKDHARRQC
ncbi:MAG: hypothetical protein OWS03_00960 [Alicyclobacillaceae bacterium]|nr:hypothetical protein [Alicyclobacillaceae bacterium]